MSGFILFLTGITLHFISWSMLEPVVPLFVVALGGSPAMVGVVVSSASLIPVLASVWIGGVTSRMGPRNSLILGGLMALFAFVIFAIARNIWVLIAAQVLFGFATLWRVIPSQTWLANTSGANLYRNFGYYAFAMTVGQFTGPPLGGWLVEFAARWSSMEYGGFTAAFLGAGTLVALSVICHFYLQKGSVDGQPSKSDGGIRQFIRVAKHRDLQIVTLLSMTVWIVIALKRSYFPVYLTTIGFSPSRIGMVLAAYSLISLFIRPLIGWMVKRLGQKYILYAAFGLSVIALVGIPGTYAFVPMMGLAMGWGFNQGMGMPVIMAMTADVVPPADRGVAVGIRMIANRVGEGIGPLIFGVVASTAGVIWTFPFAAALMAGGLAGVTLLRKVGDRLPSND